MLNKRTKIVCTIGPASERLEILEEMIQAGMNVARLNMSHGSHKSHALLARNIRAAAKEANEPVAILADLQGPKIRVGLLPAEGISLKVGEKVTLTTSVTSSGAARDSRKIPIAYRGFSKDASPGTRVLLDDGLMELKIETVRGNDATAKVITGGLLISHKGVNLPDVSVSIPAITAKDKEDAAFAVKQGVDFIALSFVRAASDVELLRRLVRKYNRRDASPQIIVKIEKHEALKNFDEILASADGVMVARGDLAIETPAEHVPVAQKDIIAKCREAGKPVIVATQMLDSMIRNPRPTRAEVSDVANAVIDHADAVMLSGESATGKYPLDAVKIMAEVIRDVEKSRYDDIALCSELTSAISPKEAVETVATILARLSGAKAILADSLTGRTARMISKHREDVPVFVASPSARVARQMNLLWGVRPFVIPRAKSVDELIRKTLAAARRFDVGKKGDKVIFLSGESVGRPGRVSIVGIKEL